jgi:hypothetical protein
MIRTTLLMFCLYVSAFARSDCSPVNLITMPNSPFHIIPVYDQKDSNTCYAYSASQILDYHLISQGSPKTSVHPAWIALNYALGRSRNTLDVGHTKEAIERINIVKNCDSSIVREALINWAGTRKLSDADIIAFIERYSTPSQSPPLFDQRRDRLLARLRKTASNSVDVVAKILLPYCRQRQDLQVPRVASYNFSQLPKDQAVEDFMIQRIGKYLSPISVAYCSNVWKHASYDGIDLTNLGRRDLLKPDCEYHESLIVGRKIAGNSCQLLVRNSWGREWRSANRQWKCLCKDKVTGKFIDDCTSLAHSTARYDVEACWIPSDKLSRNVGVVSFIE